uniref:tumor necrosis factor receptor superfamily member 6B-like n=1 Tax=Pristiophorus japonicus TaxID=55135 RepID=UPI00398F5130
MRSAQRKSIMIAKYIITIVLMKNISSVFAVIKAKPTYQRRDAITGQMLTCEQCPPGTFVEKHCTSLHPTICGPCPDLHYTQYWNYLQKCRYCNVFCGDQQYEKHQCNITHNRVCECKAGYYFEFEFCLKHTNCPHGVGVIKMGTPYSDTDCKQCTAGHFSSRISSSEPCFAHTNCIEEGLEVNVPGDRYHNTLCTSCKKYSSNGTFVNGSAVSTCDEAIIQFVAYQKIPQKKLKKFLNLLQIEEGRTFIKQLIQQNKHVIHEKLHPLLMKWKKSIMEDNILEKILHILKKAKLKNVIKNVQERFM